jgi:hypothetical protein
MLTGHYGCRHRDTFEAIYIFVPRLVVDNEERILESTWGGVPMTISDIHDHLLKKVCGT